MRIALPLDSVVRRRVLIALGVAGVLVVSGTIYAISSDGKTNTQAPITYELAKSDVLKIQAAPLTRTLRLSGSLTPLRHAEVKSNSAGTVLEIRAQEGDRVHANALLVRIDPRNLQAELDARAAALRKAQADLVLATKNRDNSVTLLKQKLISQNAFDQTEAAYASSVANAEAAQAQVRLAKIALNDTEIRAEFDGVVATRTAQVGERVMPDSALLSLVDLSTMQLEAMVAVADVPEVKVGQSAHFTVDGFGNREFTGRVERINPQTQPGTRSVTVYLSVANRDGALKGGMFGDGILLLQKTAPVIAVPSRAIRTDNAGQYVLALQGGIVARTPVVTGEIFSDSGLTVIDKGLSDSAQIIVAPATTLKPGARATLAASES